ncbi:MULTISPECIES: S8 family peptidase [unclassified Paenibacillus]|uniref:S8 family peptidase n=1 Tax=unclassified Paenibacillus TaxID=185978 RepID=UPI001AE0F489|nr:MULTISPECIES: S8 family peptidase [unclassified Paenibacillus]MBP1156314.1 type VII secretion-associated serine protease mycosin [Paenibacillus sp. PvP091]MBP1168300.1 type VII secretion-associated serine protease mycosin [Paenibacillus sp. PvR098]MBP2439328.1 type VII secretion-associated serine protease mycosin [Paenibacillus sp. PvP052]
MWKYVMSVLLVVAGVALIFPRGDEMPRPETVTSAAELQMKQMIMNQDIARTDELCRSECSMLLHRTVQELKTKGSAEVINTLKKVQAEQPHMELLTWTKAQQPLTQGVTTGALRDTARQTVEPYLIEAKRQVDAGKAYQSNAIQADGSTYFVIGIPSGDGSTALLSAVRQQILQQVADHQRKNLRMVAYPSEGRYNIESVDADSLQDVKVDHPEDNEGTSHYHVNQVVVKFKNEPTENNLAQIRKDIGGGQFRKLGYTYVFESGNMEAKQLMSYFKKWNIEYAEPHFLYLTNQTAGPEASNTDSVITPNDSLYRRYQWNLPQIETEAGWNITKGSQDVIVAVVDTGVDIKHPDLSNQLVSGYNVVNPESDPMDDVGHGTHVAGVVGALVNNNLGVAGMSWYNRIMPVKVLDQSGAGSTYAVAQGIIWATDHGAKVINMSLGNYADAEFLHDAIRYAFDRDVILIAASGNDNTERPGYPAAYPEVFAVAAVDSQKSKASFSNYGDYIDVAAPGVSIASTYPQNQYAALSGTSMASPHVTALAALIRSANPELKNTEVMQLMRDTAMDLGDAGKDKYFGYGLIDVVAALKAAQPRAAGHETETQLSGWPQWLRRLLMNE